jgi:hypothetical protein
MTKLESAETLQDVVKGIKEASNETSLIPNLLKDGRTSKDLKTMLGYVKDNANLRKKLSSKLLAATSVD